MKIWLLCCLVTALVNAGRAHSRGYSPRLYAGLAFVLGPGSLGLTWLLTRHPPQRLRQLLVLAWTTVMGAASAPWLLLPQLACRPILEVHREGALQVPLDTQLLMAIPKELALLLALVSPSLGYFWVEFHLRRGQGPGPALWPLALAIMLLTPWLNAILLPYTHLVGFIGG